MKRILFLTVIILMTGGASKAQDLIYLNDGTRILARNVKQQNRKVVFSPFTSGSNETKSLESRDVHIILYEDGRVKKPQIVDTMRIISYFHRNFITFRATDMVRGNITLSYQRLSKDGMRGFNIPFSVTFSNYPTYGPEIFDFEDEYVITNSRFYTGFGYQFYPAGQGKARYFTGPEIQLGIYGKPYDSDQNGHHSYGYKDEFFGKIYIKNGLLLTPSPAFSMSVVLMLGIRYAPTEKYTLRTTAEPGFYLSYRF